MSGILSSQDCKSVDSLSRISRGSRGSRGAEAAEGKQFLICDGGTGFVRPQEEDSTDFYESVCLNLSERMPRKSGRH